MSTLAECVQGRQQGSACHMKKPNDAEKQQLMNEGNCFTRKQYGHIARNCPFAVSAISKVQFSGTLLTRNTPSPTRETKAPGEQVSSPGNHGATLCKIAIRSLIGGESFVLPCTLTMKGIGTTVKALIDTGADCYALIDRKCSSDISKKLDIPRDNLDEAVGTCYYKG